MESSSNAVEEKRLPVALRHLVSWSVALLGACIREEYGEVIYQEVERTRQEMKALRGQDTESNLQTLRKTQGRYRQLSEVDLHRIAHSFSLMLELINHCEIAYRTFRVAGKAPEKIKECPDGITYVLTAHPTEARSAEILGIFQVVQVQLLKALEIGYSESEVIIRHALKIALHLPMARSIKPTVKDEAESIYSQVLKPEILDEMIRLKERGIPVYFRAWVGGDKDGHPGVDESSMVESLQISRRYLIAFALQKIESTQRTMELLKGHHKEAPSLLTQLRSLEKKLLDLNEIKKNDGKKVATFMVSLHLVCHRYESIFGVLHPDLINCKQLLWIFPAIVIPLELREDSREVKSALTQKDAAICRMLRMLKDISHGFEPRWYVRGFVLSMVESAEDFLNGIRLSEKVLGSLLVPVVPLFENEKALQNAIAIIEETFSKLPRLVDHHKLNYGGRFEVMLGYSDSAKENGVFTSRFLISQSLYGIDRLFRKHQLTPVFFHGSGGSVERGGGSVREQTQWWPRGAVSQYKATVQGEMISRTFANATLMRRQVEIISGQLLEPRVTENNPEHQKILGAFSSKVRSAYIEITHDPAFLRVIELATPYSFLRHLKMGSRPTKRSGALSPATIRAIPWILCWTQTRTLFPGWWGIGQTYKSLSKEDKKSLKETYKDSALLRSFVKNLGFTLAKVELPIWRLYLESTVSDKNYVKTIYEAFEAEFSMCVSFVQDLSQKKSLLWFRPWLEESIRHRSSMIHPLNIIQIEALITENPRLVRETVTGISCGMMTTG